jgi:TolB-like protein/Flp pilus assembly protein TadD/DNA-binding winged helix-turn-helix (wHTH) protein
MLFMGGSELTVNDLYQSFYLGDLLVEPLTGTVTGPSGTEHLPPKAAAILLSLASQPGTVVSREHLIEDAWGNEHGSSEALHHAISEIRHALGDHPEHPVFIQTLPKRGYRLLIAPVPVDAATAAQKPPPALSGTSFLDNLQHRGVIETGIAYLVAGWLLIQVVDVVGGQLYLPGWTGTFVTALVIAGFPIALALSWFLDFRDGRAVVGSGSAADMRRQRFSRTYISIIGALLVASITVWVYDSSIGLPSEEIPLPRVPVAENSIAVLPFINIDGGDETQVFANGLVEDVITRLSRVPGLLVSSRSDSFSLPPNSASRQVRDRLRVAMYLEGSVQFAGDQVRVIVQLIDSSNGFHLLSRRFARPQEDFFNIQADITNLTVANLRVALPPGTREVSMLPVDRPKLDAYVLYRRGIEESRKPVTADSIAQSLQWFDKALTVDPEYAAAYAGKCALYANSYPATDDPAYIDLAEAACAEALDLNPHLDIVHVALGDLYRSTGRYNDAESSYLLAMEADAENARALMGLGQIYMLQQRMDEAESHLRQAIGLHPGDWSAYNTLGHFLYRSGRYREAAEQYGYVVSMDRGNMVGWSNLGTALMLGGHFEEAEPAFQQALALEPTHLAYSNLGLLYYYVGRLDAAIDAHQQAVELAPNDPLTWANLGDALWFDGDSVASGRAFATAETLARSALGVNPNDANALMDLAWISAMLGKHEDARRLIDSATGQAPDDPYVHYYDGLIWLKSGNPEAALGALEAASAKGYPLQLLAAEPHLQELHRNPRFRAIIGDI